MLMFYKNEGKANCAVGLGGEVIARHVTLVQQLQQSLLRTRLP
jgi:hypothetical protein